ncbi:alpha-xylosidase [Bacillus sp. A116_S68]|nr:alpha-xylosidase [Bacillus sp. A116_S68]
MKFTDGNWLIREGLDLITPVQLFRETVNEKQLTLLLAPIDLSERADQLDVSMLTVTYSAPLPDVIKVTCVRHKGGVKRGPEFTVAEQEDEATVIKNTKTDVTLTSGSLQVKAIKGPRWTSEYVYNDQHITSSGFKSKAHVTRTATKETFMREELDLSVGETIYGLGERFTPLVRNGQVVDTWNKDGGTSSEQSYKNVPFYLSNKGYGVFVNHPENVSFEVGSEKVSKMQFSVTGETLEYYIIGGGSPKKVLENYTALTGKPALPPAWSFGLWLTTSFTTDYDEQTVNTFVDGMAERHLPLRVFHFDCFWMKALQWCDFQWDKDVFPDPKGMLSRLKEKGLKLSVWINPYIAQASPLFDEAVEKGYLIKKKNGDVWQWDKWQPGMGIVDFTNEQACRWYTGHLDNLLNMGVDSFKTDFGERIPTDVVYHDGSDPMKMHNYYAYLYNQVVFQWLEKARGKNDAVLFARSSTAGGQKFPVHWGGDCDASYVSMAESLRGGLSLGLSGFGFWSHDIGGFESTAPADLYKRWIAFGLLSSHSRLHGSKSYRVPWIYDEEAVDVLRFFTSLKHSLMPYLYQQAYETTKTGIPMMRAMMLEFPEDPACDYVDRQYMLGDALLVAPIFNEEGRVNYYLPKGTWTHLLTNETVEGGTWKEGHYDYFSLPLFVRSDVILPIGDNIAKPDYEYADNVTCHLFGLQTNKTVTIRDIHGKIALTLTVNVNEDGSYDVIPDNPMNKQWQLIIRDMTTLPSVENGEVDLVENGVSIVPEDTSTVVNITFECDKRR